MAFDRQFAINTMYPCANAAYVIMVYGGFRPLDVTYAHHLTTYLAGLQKLP